MIASFEKSRSNIQEEVWSCKIFYLLTECFLYNGNPYVDGVHEILSDDMSYKEVYIIFHDRNFYDLWFEEFKDVYVPLREQAFAEFRANGVTVTEYLDELNAGGVNPGTRLSSEFVTRYPEKLSQKLDSQF